MLWHRHGNYLLVTNDQGAREHLVGDQDMAARLAQEEGLEPVPTSDGTHRWVRRESACQVR